MIFPTETELHLGLKDIRDGLANHRIWWRLALLSRKEQQKRSVLGAVWNTIGILIMVLLFGVLYARLFNQPISKHLPYVACGLVVWLFYAEVIVRSCVAFTSHAVFIQQLTLPKSIYLYRLLALEILSFSYAVVLILVPILSFTVGFSLHAFLVLGGLLLIVANLFFAATLLAVISLRFRDVSPLVGHLMRPLMFVTPIIWNADNFPDRALFITWNPFFHIVEIVRAPLLGRIPEAFSYIYLLVITLLIIVFSIAIFARYRSRVAFWV